MATIVPEVVLYVTSSNYKEFVCWELIGNGSMKCCIVQRVLRLKGDFSLNSDRLLCVSYLNAGLNFATFNLKTFVFCRKHVNIRSKIWIQVPGLKGLKSQLFRLSGNI